MKDIGVAQIGHKFIGKAHAFGYSNVGFFFDPPLRPIKKVLCGKGDDLGETAQKWGFEQWTEDWQEAIDTRGIEIVDVCAPSVIHKDIVVSAAKRRRHIFCEKPLAMNLDAAREMLEAVNSADVRHTVGFNYRKVPALAFAKKMIVNDELGRIFHFRGLYSQDWLTDPQFPLAWRLRKSAAGGGSSWDLGAHVIDLARYLIGDIREVISNKVTFIKKRPVAKIEDGLTAIAGEETGTVDVDDACSFLASFDNGALGLFEVTRYGTGHRNQNQIEIYGSKGGIIWRGFEKMNELEFYSKRDAAGMQGYRTIQIGESDHPYLPAYWPAGHIIGFAETFTHEIFDFLKAIANGENTDPSFEDGLKVQEVLTAVDTSAETKQWVKISDV